MLPATCIRRMKLLTSHLPQTGTATGGRVSFSARAVRFTQNTKPAIHFGSFKTAPATNGDTNGDQTTIFSKEQHTGIYRADFL